MTETERNDQAIEIRSEAANNIIDLMEAGHNYKDIEGFLCDGNAIEKTGVADLVIGEMYYIITNNIAVS